MAGGSQFLLLLWVMKLCTNLTQRIKFLPGITRWRKGGHRPLAAEKELASEEETSHSTHGLPQLTQASPGCCLIFSVKSQQCHRPARDKLIFSLFWFGQIINPVSLFASVSALIF